MEPAAIPDYPRGLTFEQVWAAIHADKEEFNRKFEAEREEFNRRLKAGREELDRKIQADKEKLDREIQADKEKHDREMREFRESQRESAARLDKQMGELGRRFGDVIEHMVRPCLKMKFQALGFNFTICTYDFDAFGQHRILAEVDILLENGDTVMVVEVKSKPSARDIKDHVTRMARMRVYADSKGDRRKYMGAIAGMVFADNVRSYALKSGFYVIEPSGDSFDVIEPKGEYRPRAW